MKVFLIVIGVLALLIVLILSLSATVTLVYDKKWTTKVQVLFIEKEISLSKILSFVLFPEKKAQEVSDKRKKEKDKNKKKVKATEPPPEKSEAVSSADTVIESEKVSDKTDDETAEKAPSKKEDKPKKSNPIKKLWDEEGIVGILSLVSNLVETANSAILTLFRGLHIYSLYVMIIVGGGDAASIAHAYGRLCSFYYPVKGIILNGMKVDNYDDYIQPDFIAPSTEFEFQLIASINVGLLVKVALKAGFIFLKNLIKNKKGD